MTDSYFPFETFEQREDELRGTHRVTVGHGGISLRLKVALDVLKAAGVLKHTLGKDGRMTKKSYDHALDCYKLAGFLVQRDNIDTLTLEETD